LKRGFWLANAFHELVLRTTPIPYLAEVFSRNLLDEFDFHRRQALYAFDKVVDLSKKKGPYFVCAHIVKPHEPFVFNEFCEPIAPHRRYGLWYTPAKGMDRNEYIELYKRQLSCINKKVISMLEAILHNSSEPPIIIVQSDHGPTLEYDHKSLSHTNIHIRFPILNALYLPHGGAQHIYARITPVNTWRIILNYYFVRSLNYYPIRVTMHALNTHTNTMR